MIKKMTIRIRGNRLDAYKKGAKYLDLSITSLVLNAVEEYLYKHLTEPQIDEITVDTFWKIQKR